MNDEWIVVTGNIADGFTFYGPFVRAEWANEWAEDNLRNLEWWVVTCHKEVQ